MLQKDTSRAVGPSDDALLAIGKLQFLASYCPQHRRWPSYALARLFHPAVNQGCVRFFENDAGRTAAALIWARLSDETSTRMLQKKSPPLESDWTTGDTLWFLDLLAPFGNGGHVARHIARNPPNEPFFFARFDDTGALQRVVQGNARKPPGRRMSVRQYGMAP